MTEHDSIRQQRALQCDRDSLESLKDALRGLQSTDDPSLVPLHDDLMAQYQVLKAKLAASANPSTLTHRNSPVAIYCLATLVEEAGEALDALGKALRFGLDTSNNHKDQLLTAQQLCEQELGHVLGAVDFAVKHGVLMRPIIDAARDYKLKKLLNPEAKDNLGRQLAPQPSARKPDPNCPRCGGDGWIQDSLGDSACSCVK